MTERLNRILTNCFKTKRGNQPELRKGLPDTSIAKVHLEKAHSNLKSMRLMFNNEFFDWTVICGYYAMYHAVLASLYHIGIRAYSHICAISAFQKFYVERGIAEKEYVKYLQRAKQLEKHYSDSLREARENRVKVQYGTEILMNEDAEWIVEDAEDFVLRIEELLA